MFDHKQVFLVICATRRLAKTIKIGEFGQWHDGQAYHEMDFSCFFIDDWLDSLIESALILGEISPAKIENNAPLNDLQETLIWEKIIKNSGFSARESISVTEVAMQAQGAAKKAFLWGMSNDAFLKSASFEVNVFFGWWQQVQKEMAQLNRMSLMKYRYWQLEQIAKIHAHSPGLLPHEIKAVGFDSPNPWQREFFSKLTSIGVLISEPVSHEPGKVNAVFRYAKQADEFYSVAIWAKQWLQEHKIGDIAILATSLSSMKDDLVSALDRVLDFDESDSDASKSSRKKYDISLGAPLNSHEVVCVAILIAKIIVQYWTEQKISLELMDKLFLKPYWADEAELDDRHLMQLHWRQASLNSIQNEFNDIDGLIRFAQEGQTISRISSTIKFLKNLEKLIQSEKKRGICSYAGWVQLFKKCLISLNWPGNAFLESRRYQVALSFAKMLDSLICLDDLSEKVTIIDFLTVLNHRAGRTIFQPKGRNDVRLYVSELGDYPVSHYDAVWVLGMSEANWPPVVKTDPFLPQEEQKRLGLPQASVLENEKFVSLVQKRIMCSAKQLFFSWSELENKSTMLPASWVRLLSIGAASSVVPELQPIWHAEIGKTLLEKLIEESVPPMAESSRVRGGVSALKAQANYPAWFYYEYRLGLSAVPVWQEDQFHLVRGRLVHEVLEGFWSGKNDARIELSQEHADRQRLDEIIQKCLQSQHSLSGKWKEVEAIYLSRLIKRYLAIEASIRQGEPFEIHVLEKKESATISGLEFYFVIDRVDQLKNGRLLLLDYKSSDYGKLQQSMKYWFFDRLIDPQIPIYMTCSSFKKAVSGGLLASVFLGVDDFKCFIGVLEQPFSQRSKIGQQWQDSGLSWEGLLGQWHEKIESLVLEIKTGVFSLPTEEITADVLKNLAYSHVKPLLRIEEAKQMKDGVWFDEFRSQP